MNLKAHFDCFLLIGFDVLTSLEVNELIPTDGHMHPTVTVQCTGDDVVCVQPFWTLLVPCQSSSRRLFYHGKHQYL